LLETFVPAYFDFLSFSEQIENQYDFFIIFDKLIVYEFARTSLNLRKRKEP